MALRNELVSDSSNATSDVRRPRAFEEVAEEAGEAVHRVDRRTVDDR